MRHHLTDAERELAAEALDAAIDRGLLDDEVAAQELVRKLRPERRVVRLRIPRPTSTKNRRQLAVIGGRARSFTSSQAREDRAQFVAQLHRHFGDEMAAGATAFGDQDLCVRATHHVASDELTLEVWPVGPKPRGKTGRRSDLQNVLEGPLDWMQGVVYVNDSQVVELELRRVLDD